MPWEVICCRSWAKKVRSSSSGGISWKSGCNRPWSTRATIGTDCTWRAWPMLGWASMSTRPAATRPSSASAMSEMSSASWALSGIRLGE